MTVSELIKMLSALEKQDQEIEIQGDNLFIVPIKEVTECWGDGVSYVLSDGEPISHERAVKSFWEHAAQQEQKAREAEKPAP